MGLTYLSNYKWFQVTREERFFCAHLYFLIQEHGVPQFLSYINQKHQKNLNESDYWEIGYEVCFYRDLWNLKGKQTELFSPKRTFDLCLFSEKVIIIIEAKADQQFESDQLSNFEKDIEQVKIETGVQDVFLFGLKSSKYDVPNEYLSVFNGPILDWSDLSVLYNNDPILQRANDIFDPDKEMRYGKNNISGYMTGIQLQEQYDKGNRFFVGRSQGIDGLTLKNDIQSGKWKSQKYETNAETKSAPNKNWFSLSQFIEMVKGMQN